MLYNNAINLVCIRDEIIRKVITFIQTKRLTIVIIYVIIMCEKICLGGS